MPLIDGISRRELQTVAIEVLRDANTMALDRVYEPRDWPTTPEMFPLLMVQTPMERKVALYPGLLEFTSTITLVVVGRLVSTTAESVNREVDALAAQVEDALLTNRRFAVAIQQYAGIEVRVTVTAEGKRQIGEVSITFNLVVYQSYGALGVPLTDIQSTLAPPPIATDTDAVGNIVWSQQPCS